MKKFKSTLTLSDINWLKSELIPAMADAVQNRLDKKLDKIYTLVDGFAGEVKTYREQQELNSHKLSNHDDRIEKLEKHTKLIPLTD